MGAYRAALAAVLVVAACGGNPFATPVDPVDPVDPTDPSAAVSVDPAVARDVKSATYRPGGGGSLTMEINGVIIKPGDFTRAPALDVDGYKAFTFQNRITQRSYIALVANNARGTLRSIAASDGGQFNRHEGGAQFERLDVYVTRDIGTFSYAGTYAGIFAPGDATSDLPAGLVANRPYRTLGDALINASFGTKLVEGGVDNRWVLDATGARVDMNLDGVVNDDDKLPAITFPQMAITANGQFVGDVEFSAAPDTPDQGSVIGTVNGVFSGQASDVAGAIIINPLPGNRGIWEHGVFNLPRCDMAGASPLCTPVPSP